MEFKTNVTFGLNTGVVKDLDKLYPILGLTSRSQLGSKIITEYLAQKKIREMLTN